MADSVVAAGLLGGIGKGLAQGSRNYLRMLEATGKLQMEQFARQQAREQYEEHLALLRQQAGQRAIQENERLGSRDPEAGMRGVAPLESYLQRLQQPRLGTGETMPTPPHTVPSVREVPPELGPMGRPWEGPSEIQVEPMEVEVPERPPEHPLARSYYEDMLRRRGAAAEKFNLETSGAFGRALGGLEGAAVIGRHLAKPEEKLTPEDVAGHLERRGAETKEEHERRKAERAAGRRPERPQRPEKARAVPLNELRQMAIEGNLEALGPALATSRPHLKGADPDKLDVEAEKFYGAEIQRILSTVQDKKAKASLDKLAREERDLVGQKKEALKQYRPKVAGELDAAIQDKRKEISNGIGNLPAPMWIPVQQQGAAAQESALTPGQATELKRQMNLPEEQAQAEMKEAAASGAVLPDGTPFSDVLTMNRSARHAFYRKILGTTR